MAGKGSGGGRRAAWWLGGALTLALAGGVASSWAPDLPVDALVPRWAPPPSTFVTVDGMRVHQRDEGPRTDPVPIILLHGTSSSLHTWEGWSAALRPTRRVLRLDLPGFGLSEGFADGDYAIAHYVAFLGRWMDQRGVRRAVVAGNSLGGQLAWALAVADSSRVAGLVLVDAAGFPLASTSVPIGFRMARMPVVNRLFTQLLPRSVIRSSLENVYGDPSRVDDLLVTRYHDLTRRAGNREAVVRRLTGTGPTPDPEALRGLRLPALILWGERDRLIPPVHAARFAERLAGSRVVRFDALGHVPQEEDPVQTVAAVLPFVRGIVR